MAKTGERIRSYGRSARAKLGIVQKKTISIVDKRPLASFFGLLGFVLVLIILGNFLRQPQKAAETKEPTPKSIQVYSVGKAPKIELSARIEKSGALKVVAQSPGFIQNINKWEGESVFKGEQLFWFSNNAQGGTIPSVSREIAEQSYNFAAGNFDLQIELINKRREIAEKSETMSDELRSITDQSLGGTRNLISLNEQILSGLDAQLAQLASLSSSDSAVLQIQQARSGVLSGLTQLRLGLRNAEYQSSNDQEGAKLAELTKDIALKGLELEEKSLAFNKELSRLNLRISQITESLMYPASPCAGTIERIYVDVGESVGPGMPIASISCDKNWTSAIVPVSMNVAKNVSRIEKSVVKIGDAVVTLTPRYITTEPTEGSLHAIIFDIPEEYADKLADGMSLAVSVPVGAPQTSSIVPYVPLDAVYQTETEAYIYVITEEAGKKIAKSRTVILGPVYGSYVEVLEGLNDADQVIIDRNVLEGDVVNISN